MENQFDLKRLEELALRASRTGRTQYTRFLDPALGQDVARIAARQGVCYKFFGGYPDAERAMAAFYDMDEPEDASFPLTPLLITWNGKFAQPAHRDLLGAVMGLGIERDATGDIAMATRRGNPCAVLFSASEMVDYIAANLESAGRASIKVQATDLLPDINPPEGRELRVTVLSPRLDAVLAAGYNLSRAQAQKLIAAGLVKLNHLPNLKSDAPVKPSDLISARGCGRLKVLSDDGQSRRGRVVLNLFRYGK